MLVQKTTLIALAAFFALDVMGTPVDKAVGSVSNNAIVAERAIAIATNPLSACNCPHNCDYNEGHDCRFYSGPSTNSEVNSGKCTLINHLLICEAT
ncbi:hypothetical protein G7Z17_g1494 [Cylindrodendrum hubeiense]|uniref:Uncharacterized protein n=1 Tax=Cylindrodendrum hubeiense TaxID=595255 RepID=A0A9P5LK28_9HYPO|nr:hypothetical protein G7Z17_g1494 [Cylindrodendrum hubeiense]